MHTSNHTPISTTRTLRHVVPALLLTLAGAVLQPAAARADVISQSKSTGKQIGHLPAPVDLTFNRFDTSLGVLTEVYFALNCEYNYIFTVSPGSPNFEVVSILMRGRLFDDTGSSLGAFGSGGGNGVGELFGDSIPLTINGGGGGPFGTNNTTIASELFEYSDSLAPFTATFVFVPLIITPPAGFTATPSYEDQKMEVTLTYTYTAAAVPEPGTAVSVLLGALALTLRSTGRRKM